MGWLASIYLFYVYGIDHFHACDYTKLVNYLGQAGELRLVSIGRHV